MVKGVGRRAFRQHQRREVDHRAHVEAGEVEQLERSHAKPGGELEDPVDDRMLRDAFAGDAQGLVA